MSLQSGSVRIGEHFLIIQVSWVFDKQTQTAKPLESYERLRGLTVDEEYLLRSVMLGFRSAISPSSTAIRVRRR